MNEQEKELIKDSLEFYARYLAQKASEYSPNVQGIKDRLKEKADEVTRLRDSFSRQYDS